MAGAALPRMMDAFPGLVAEIDRLLELPDRHDPLIGTVRQLSHYDRCRRDEPKGASASRNCAILPKCGSYGQERIHGSIPRKHSDN